MLLNYEINTNLEINFLMDLGKLKDLQSNGLKVNKSELARRLGKDRRTIAKYINGFEKYKSQDNLTNLLQLSVLSFFRI